MNCAPFSPNSAPSRGGKSGFTLVELMISALIMTVMVSAIFAVLQAGDTVFHFDSGKLDLHQEGRRAMDVMSRELRQTSPSSVTISSGGSRVDFQLPLNITADPIVYSQNVGYYLSGNQLVREHPAGTTEIIGNNITDLGFCCRVNGTCDSSCAASRLMEVDFTVGKSVRRRAISYRLKEKLRMRNND